MRTIALAVLAAVLAAGWATGCATTAPGPTAGTMAGDPYQSNLGALGVRADEDMASSAGNPFRIAALVLYPVGLILQRAFEGPYVAAATINPEWFGISETEQEYLERRWGYRQAIHRIKESRGAESPPAAK